jgi:hypothetical protein
VGVFGLFFAMAGVKDLKHGFAAWPLDWRYDY